MSSHQRSRKRQALCRLLSLILPNRIARHILPSTQIDSLSGSRETRQRARHVDRVSACDKGRVTISMLPEDVLLPIFHFDRLAYLDEEGDAFPAFRVFWRWHRLVHVCQRWRSVIFGSPHFLDLRLVCLPG
ncbi:hypothetical protein BJV77DRAFT_1152763, partial [Russula vinacea]